MIEDFVRALVKVAGDDLAFELVSGEHSVRRDNAPAYGPPSS